MVFVYAETRRRAAEWARAQGLSPRHCRLVGNRSHRGVVGQTYRPGDRVVVVGAVSGQVDALVKANRMKSGPAAPEIERMAALSA